jgi:hypothetical protein
MMASWLWHQREAIKASFKSNSESSWLNKEKKKCVLKLLRSLRNKFSIHKIVEKEKEIHLVLLLHLNLQKKMFRLTKLKPLLPMAIVCDKFLVKMEKC